MEEALSRFHNFKYGFLLGQAVNEAKANTNALRTELVKK